MKEIFIKRYIVLYIYIVLRDLRQRRDRENSVRKRRVVERIHGMK